MAKKFQYRIVEYDKRWFESRLLRELDHWGALGWELCTMNRCELIFKKEL